MGEAIEKELQKIGVTVSKPVLAMIAITFGILMIVFPDPLQRIVGLYFLIQSVLLFADYLEPRKG